MGKLRDLIVERFGRPVTPFENRTVTSVGLTAAIFLRQDPDRLGFLIVNLSVNNLWIGPFANVSTTKGIKIPPSGGSVTSTWDEDFDVVGKEWYAIADGAGSAILTEEYIATS